MNTTIKFPASPTPAPAPVEPPATERLIGRYARLSVIIAVMF